MPLMIEEAPPITAEEKLDLLVRRLDEAAPFSGVDLLTRQRAVAVLEALIETLRPVTDVELGIMDTGERLVKDHGSVALLVELVDALGDLDRSKTHEALEAAGTAQGARLTTAQRKRDETLAEAVLVLQRRNKYKTRRKAEIELARLLRKAGYRRDSDPLTQKGLENLFTRQRESKKP